MKHLLTLSLLLVALWAPGCSGSSWERRGDLTISAYDSQGVPVRAKITVAGQTLGHTPWKGRLPEGGGPVEITHWLYQPWKGLFQGPEPGMAVTMEQNLDHFAMECRKGSGLACFVMSEIMLHQDNAATLADRIFAFQRRAAQMVGDACQQDEVFNCALLALMSLEEKGKSRDYDEAKRLGADACTRGEDLGCVVLARTLVITHDRPDEAFSLLNTRCRDNDTESCAYLGQLYLDQAVAMQGEGKAELSRDLQTQGVTTLEESCVKGSAFGCSRIGDLYYRGSLVTANPYKSGTYLKRACVMGSGRGCYLFGKMVGQGETDLPAAEAATLFSRACLLGEQEACTSTIEP